MEWQQKIIKINEVNKGEIWAINTSKSTILVLESKDLWGFYLVGVFFISAISWSHITQLKYCVWIGETISLLHNSKCWYISKICITHWRYWQRSGKTPLNPIVLSIFTKNYLFSFLNGFIMIHFHSNSFL